MTDAGPAIRQAMVALADAMSADPGRLAAAEDLLRQAFDEHGEDPPAWELSRRLGDLALRRSGGESVAFRRYLDGMIAAPAPAAELLNTAVFDLLNGPAGLECVRSLSDRTIERLRVRAHEPEHPISGVMAMILMLRGSVTQAAQISQSRSAASAPNEQELDSVLAVVARVTVLLRDDRIDEADAVLAAHGPSKSDSAVRPLRAWVAYARGDLHAALAECRAGAPTVDTTIAEALILLRQAAEGLDDGEISHAALTAATRAARLDPRRADVLVVRAQILLERDLDLREGRELLGRGLEHLQTGTGEWPYWWMLQQRARTDERHGYFRMEFAAACERWREVLEVAAEIGMLTTTTHQDGAIWQVRARALREVDDDAAADAFRSAATNYGSAGDTVGQLECLRTEVELRPHSPAALDAAENLWVSTFSDGDGSASTASAAHSALRDALQLVHVAGAALPAELMGRANVMLGLIGQRQALLGSDRPEDVWVSLPNLIIAAELESTEAYYCGHLSTALASASLLRWAQFYGDRAHRLLPDDEWVRDVFVGSQIAWAGFAPDAEVARIDDQRLRAHRYAAMALNTGRHELLDAYTLGVLDDGDVWSRLLWVYARAVMTGYAGLRSKFEETFAELELLGDPSSCADLGLLVAPEAVTEYAVQGLQSGRISQRRFAWFTSMAELVTSGGRVGLGACRSAMQELATPAVVRGLIHVDFPLLVDAHRDEPQLLAAVAKLTELAGSCLPRLHNARLVDDPIPSDLGPVGPLADLVAHLLRAASHTVDRRPSAAYECLQGVDVSALPGDTSIARAGLAQWQESLARVG